MSYIELVVTIAFAMQMVICVLFALPYKRSKKHIFWLVLITIMEYNLVVWTNLDVNLYWLAYVVEFFGTVLVLALFNSGNLWRNFMISWINFQCANFLLFIEGAIFSYFADIKLVLILGEIETGNTYPIFEIFLMLCNSLTALFVSRKLFKFEYNNDGKVYRLIVAIIVILGTILGLKKHQMIEEFHSDSWLEEYKLYITTIAIIIVIMYLVGYFYNMSEIRRLLKEREELKKIIEKNYIQYANAIENNKELEKVKQDMDEDMENVINVFDVDVSTLSLTGNLTIDTLVSDYYKKSKKNNIILELCIEPLANNSDRDMKLVTIIDELMKQAFKALEDNTDKGWIYLRICQNKNSVIIKLEYDKPDGYKLKMRDIKLTHKVVHMDKGAITITNKDKEVCVGILLP